MNKFKGKFGGQIFKLFIMSVFGGFLELLGIAMLFPCLFVLTSSDTGGGKIVLDYCSKIFPNLSQNKIALILALLMVFIFLFKNIFMIFYTKFQNNFARIWSDYVNEILIKKLLNSSYSDSKKISNADKYTLLYSSVRDISLDFVLRCIILFANGVVALFIVALLFYKFTLSAFLSTVFILIWAYFENNYFKNKAKKLGDKSVELLNNLAEAADFTIKSEKEIVISNKENYFVNYLLNSDKKISENYAKRISYGNFPLYVTEIGVILAFLIMVITIFLSNDITKNEIISSVAIISLMVLRLVPQLNKVLISMYAINVSKQKVIWFLERLDKISKNQAAPLNLLDKITFQNEIELKNVTFEHEKNKGIYNINLKIKKGDFIGIIGASGAGKTTFADILSGLYIPNNGKYLIDGVEISTKNIKSLQKKISFLPQESAFINDTVLKNIAFGEDNINTEKAALALKKAGLSINLNEKMNLSAGQKKRIALARCYYRDFEILILDEATSSLDVETENIVTENILKLKGNKTVIAIAHRLSTLKQCDWIVYFENGKIKDTGTFDFLREKYSEIDNMLKLSSFD